jgi:hypothetical protein
MGSLPLIQRSQRQLFARASAKQGSRFRSTVPPAGQRLRAFHRVSRWCDLAGQRRANLCPSTVHGEGSIQFFSLHQQEGYPNDFNLVGDVLRRTAAFAIQYGVGLVVGQWVPQDGHYPAMVYQVAFGLSVTFQAGALFWFAVPWLRTSSRYLYASFTRPSAERESRAEFAMVLVDGPILDAHDATEW